MRKKAEKWVLDVTYEENEHNIDQIKVEMHFTPVQDKIHGNVVLDTSRQICRAGMTISRHEVRNFPKEMLVFTCIDRLSGGLFGFLRYTFERIRTEA